MFACNMLCGWQQMLCMFCTHMLRTHMVLVHTHMVLVRTQVLDQDKKPLLFSLVFGEGIINDAVSIVLLTAVQVRTC